MPKFLARILLVKVTCCLKDNVSTMLILSLFTLSHAIILLTDSFMEIWNSSTVLAGLMAVVSSAKSETVLLVRLTVRSLLRSRDY